MFRITAFLLCALALLGSCANERQDDRTADLRGKSVLVFTGHGDGYVHENIAASARMRQEMAAENGFAADTTSDTAVFLRRSLAKYDAIASTRNASYAERCLTLRSAARSERFGPSGRRLLSACMRRLCTGRGWEWFTQMIGGRFDFHPPLQRLTLKVVDQSHPSTAQLPDTLQTEDELYVFKRLNPEARILAIWETAGVDWAGREPEALTPSIPAAWCNQFDGGRSWYTALGHDSQNYDDPQYGAGARRMAGRAGPAPENNRNTATNETMELEQEIRRRRTFAIISHPDAGKTTLTENCCSSAGHPRPGPQIEQNQKGATSDFMEIERQRGISVAHRSWASNIRM